jgi:hypothetical protein
MTCLSLWDGKIHKFLRPTFMTSHVKKWKNMVHFLRKPQNYKFWFVCFFYFVEIKYCEAALEEWANKTNLMTYGDNQEKKFKVELLQNLRLNNIYYSSIL